MVSALVNWWRNTFLWGSSQAAQTMPSLRGVQSRENAGEEYNPRETWTSIVIVCFDNQENFVEGKFTQKWDQTLFVQQNIGNVN